MVVPMAVGEVAPTATWRRLPTGLGDHRWRLRLNCGCLWWCASILLLLLLDEGVSPLFDQALGSGLYLVVVCSLAKLIDMPAKPSCLKKK